MQFLTVSLSILTCLVGMMDAAPVPSFITNKAYHHVTTFSSRCSRNFPSPTLSATQDDKTSRISKSARERGIYSRPSAAIERGSGFFIPGLEGPRIRLLFGITVLIADAANHLLAESQPGDIGQIIAESTAAFYGGLLLLQGIIESGGQRVSGRNDVTLDSNGDVMSQNRCVERISESLKSNDRALEAVQKLSKTILDFTPTRYALVAEKDKGILYSLNASANEATTVDTEEQTRLIKLALDALSESRGGRIALPNDHPVSVLLPPSATRCILVQKLSKYKEGDACLILGSDSLLPSFTKNDLRWIGKLAETIRQD